jgi:hypothetical protein
MLVDAIHGNNLNNYQYRHFHLNIYSHCFFFFNKNREMFLSNSEIHGINMRFNCSLHLQSTDLALVRKGVMYSGSKIYSCLPPNILIAFK